MPALASSPSRLLPSPLHRSYPNLDSIRICRQDQNSEHGTLRQLQQSVGVQPSGRLDISSLLLALFGGCKPSCLTS